MFLNKENQSTYYARYHLFLRSGNFFLEISNKSQIPHVFQNLHGGGGGGASVLRLMLCGDLVHTPQAVRAECLLQAELTHGLG